MRNIPENNLAYPVLVSMNNGSSGSGFLLGTPDKLYLITAKHVIFENTILRGDKMDLVCQTQDINDDSVEKYRIDLSVCLVQSHPTADIAAIELGTRKKIADKDAYTLDFKKGIDIIEKGKNPVVNVNASNTKLLNEVLVSNDVYLYGYPTSLGLKGTPQFDYNKPLLRKGIVANTYPVQSTIILDCPVYFGNSGGPVVEVEHTGNQYFHKVIGVITQFIPFVQEWYNPPTGIVNTEFLNSGYSVAVSMDKVFELIGFKK